MQFTVSVLLASIDKRLEEHRAAFEREQAAARHKYETALAGWRETSAPTLATNLRQLAERARKGRPITRRDVVVASGTVRNSDSDLYDARLLAPAEPEAKTYTEPQSMVALRNYLAAAEQGSTITHSALGAAGFRNMAYHLNP